MLRIIIAGALVALAGAAEAQQSNTYCQRQGGTVVCTTTNQGNNAPVTRPVPLDGYGFQPYQPYSGPSSGSRTYCNQYGSVVSCQSNPL